MTNGYIHLGQTESNFFIRGFIIIIQKSRSAYMEYLTTAFFDMMYINKGTYLI